MECDRYCATSSRIVRSLKAPRGAWQPLSRRGGLGARFARDHPLRRIAIRSRAWAFGPKNITCPLLPLCYRKGRVDRVSRLRIIVAEQMSIDPQSNVGRGVTEPLTDGDDINPGVDQLAGVGVPQRVERDLRPTDLLCELGPSRRHRLGRQRRAINVREQ